MGRAGSPSGPEIRMNRSTQNRTAEGNDGKQAHYDIGPFPASEMTVPVHGTIDPDKEEKIIEAKIQMALDLFNFLELLEEEQYQLSGGKIT